MIKTSCAKFRRQNRPNNTLLPTWAAFLSQKHLILHDLWPVFENSAKKCEHHSFFTDRPGGRAPSRYPMAMRNSMQNGESECVRLVFRNQGPVLFSARSMCNSAFSGLAACNSGRVCLVCKSISGRIFTPSFFILDEAVRPELL